MPLNETKNVRFNGLFVSTLRMRNLDLKRQAHQERENFHMMAYLLGNTFMNFIAKFEILDQHRINAQVLVRWTNHVILEQHRIHKWLLYREMLWGRRHQV